MARVISIGAAGSSKTDCQTPAMPNQAKWPAAVMPPAAGRGMTLDIGSRVMPAAKAAPAAGQTDVWARMDAAARSGGPAAAWMRDFQTYDDSLAGAIGRIRTQPQDIRGRERELDLLRGILERPVTKIALLLGAAGVGKTALVEEFVKRANAGHISGDMIDVAYLPMSLNLGQLSTLPRNELQGALSTLFERLAGFERSAQEALSDGRVRVLLFIDEIHAVVTIFGEGTKIGGDVMKASLARSAIRVVGATTRREYDSTIAVDEPLAQRFKVIELNELSPDVVREVALDWWGKVAPDCPPLSDDVIDLVIRSNRDYRPAEAEPRKTLDILEDMVAVCRRYGRAATRADVVRDFSDRLNIHVDSDFDAGAVYESVRSGVIGQPWALNRLRLGLYGVKFRERANANQPILTLLMTGPTGVGKTETTKRIAAGLWPGQAVLFPVNMTDYATAATEPAFRKVVGERVRHVPNSVVLLDEIDKADGSVLNAFLSILDEGMVYFDVENREGRMERHSASLRDAVVVATTNAGAQVFEDDAKYGRKESRDSRQVDDSELTDAEVSEVNGLMTTLRENLIANGFRPELLGRFDMILPYRALTEKASRAIIRGKIERMTQEFRDRNGIELVLSDPVRWHPRQFGGVDRDLVLFVAYKRAMIRDSNSGGARALDREITQNVFDVIVSAVAIEHPGYRRYRVSVDCAYQQDGWWLLDPDAPGRVVVTPIPD